MRALSMTNDVIEPTEHERAVASALARMVTELRIVMALATDPVARVNALRDRPRVVFRLSSSSYVDMDWDGLRLVREEPAGHGAEQVSHLTQDHHIVRCALGSKRASAVEKDANEMVRSLLRSDRQAFRRLLAWAPLVETTAYVIVATITQLLDGLRPKMLSTVEAVTVESADLVRAYLRMNAVMGRANLLATTEGSSPWLVDMARSFSWRTWTPSIAFTRERSLWLAMSGARAAAEFGPDLIGDYLEVIGRATHPMVAMDAICGLAAIGLRHPLAREEVVRGLRAAEMLARSPYDGPRPIAELGREQALRLLDEGAGQGLPPRSTRFAFDEDPLEYHASTGFPIIARLPDALTALSWELIPIRAAELNPSSSRAAGMIARAWGANRPIEGPPVLH